MAETNHTYAEALEILNHVRLVLRESPTDLERVARDSVPPGLYEHWKSTPDSCKFYLVQGVGFETDTRRLVVSTFALYQPHQGKFTPRQFLHPENGFLVPIERAQYVGPRFRLRARLSFQQMGMLLDQADELARLTNVSMFLERAQNIARFET